MQLKIITYNLHKGFSIGNMRFALPQIRDALAQTNADVVFLQEVQGEHVGKQKKIVNWPKQPQFEFLADQLWSHYAYAKNAIYRSGHHGNAILSKYPFISWENINVSASRLASRSLLHGVIQLPDEKTCHVICIHLGLFELERKHQLSILSQRIESHIPKQDNLIIAGDFNDWRQRAERHLKQDLNVQEVFQLLQGQHAKTYPAHWPLLSVDRVYCRGVKPIGCACLNTPTWKRLSDHIPLVAEFDL